MWEWIQANWKMFADIVTVVAILAFFALRKSYPRKDSFDKLEKRVSKVENAIATMPSEKTVHELQLEVERLRGDIKGIEPSLASVKNLSDMLLENELKGSK